MELRKRSFVKLYIYICIFANIAGTATFVIGSYCSLAEGILAMLYTTLFETFLLFCIHYCLKMLKM